MPVKLETMMKKIFTPKERAAIKRDATATAKRPMALRGSAKSKNKPG